MSFLGTLCACSNPFQFFVVIALTQVRLRHFREINEVFYRSFILLPLVSRQRLKELLKRFSEFLAGTPSFIHSLAVIFQLNPSKPMAMLHECINFVAVLFYQLIFQYSDMHEHRAVSHLLEGLGSRRLSHHYSMSEICEVVNTGNLQMLRHMVHNGATICYRDSNKRTPL